MTGNQLTALLESYRAGDHGRFRSVAIQAICGLRSEKDKIHAQRILDASVDNSSSEFMLRTLGSHNSALASQIPSVSLDQLHLADSIRAEVDMLLLERQRFTDLLKHNLQPRSRILLHGAPGNGKTSLAAALANSMKLNGFCMKLSSVRDSYMGATATKVDHVLKLADGGALLLLDEFDAIASTRVGDDDKGIGREHIAIVATILQCLDRQPMGVIVAATNRIDIIDPAVRRRFDVEIELIAPSAQAADKFADFVFARHEWPRSGWSGFDHGAFYAIERDCVAHIRREVLGV